MVNTISMKDMRYLNLFDKITNVPTRFCFVYNETLIFCVPHPMLYKAIGEDGKNVKKMREILRKKIKIIFLNFKNKHTHIYRTARHEETIIQDWERTEYKKLEDRNLNLELDKLKDLISAIT